MADFNKRVDYLFEQSRQAITDACNALHADHSAKGMLASGNTARKAVAIFEAETGAAISKAGGEAAALIQSRGSAWKKAMTAIRTALEIQIAVASDLLAPSMKLAGIDRSASAGAAVQKLIAEAAERLKAQVAAFEEGWTAPRPKLWNERHPIIYALALLVAGSLIGAIVTQVLPTGG